MDATAVGYLTLKLQNSTWYKCLNPSLTGSRTYLCTYGKPKNYMPPTSSDAGGIKMMVVSQEKYCSQPTKLLKTNVVKYLPNKGTL